VASGFVLDPFSVLSLSIDTSVLWENMTYAEVWTFGVYANTTSLAQSSWFLSDTVEKRASLSFRVMSLKCVSHFCLLFLAATLPSISAFA
jgi:hypothetical protein